MTEDKLSILFYEIMEEFVNDGLINEAIEEDFDTAFSIYEALEQVFIENYKVVTIEESVMSVFTNTGDPNEALIQALSEALLDETIGSAIATAVHGIGTKIAAFRAKRAQDIAQKRTVSQNRAASMAGAAAVKAKSVAKKSTGGLGSTFRTAVAQGRAEKARAVAKREYAAGTAARTKAQTASATLAAKEQKRKELASNIDTRVKAARQAVSTGARNVAGAVGRFVGKLA